MSSCAEGWVRWEETPHENLQSSVKSIVMRQRGQQQQEEAALALGFNISWSADQLTGKLVPVEKNQKKYT